MTSRLQEKERRREAREARERELAVGARRRALRQALVAVGIGAVLVAVPFVVLGRSGGGDTNSRQASSASAPGPLGQHYAGLVQRRRAAGVPTMMDTMSSRVHFHPRLKVYVDGRQVSIPANIGIDPTQDAMQMADLHTHDASGTIHVEGMSGPRLGQFFQIWGVPLSARQLGPYRAGGANAVRMWVNGRPSSAFGRLELNGSQRIVVSFGPSDALPAGA
jgi:hypothetical protein